MDTKHFLVAVLVCAVMGGGGYFGGYKAGQVVGALKMAKQNPPNSYYAPTTVDQSTKKVGYMFGVKPAKAWGIGICHD